MHLAGPILTPAQIADPAYTAFSSVTMDVTLAGAPGGGTVTRAAGDWITDGFLVGQRVDDQRARPGSWRVKTIIGG